jgi:hypothetical protein
MEVVLSVSKQVEGLTEHKVLQLFEAADKNTKSSCKELLNYI